MFLSYHHLPIPQVALLLLLPLLGIAPRPSLVDASCCNNGDDLSTTTISVILDVTQHGVIGDGLHDDTEAMRRILSLSEEEDCPYDYNLSCCCHQRHIVIPKDIVVLSYPLNLTSCTTLQVDGTLLAVPSTELWPILPPVIIYGSSEDSYHGVRVINQYHPFVYAANATRIRITGSGTIHGNGQYWWDMFQNASAPLQFGGRPNLIQTVYCEDVEIDCITLVDAAFWTLHPMLSNDIRIHHMSIRAPMYAPNVDGIDPDSCQNVLIEYNDIACGDDHIAIKAGLCGIPNDKARNCANMCQDPSWQHERSIPTRNVTVRHNIFRTGMGIAIGSESSGGIEDVYIYNNSIGVCDFGHDDPQTSCGWGPGLHLKTTITRSGFIQNIHFNDNTVWNNTMFILVETNYHGENKPQPLPDGYPKTVVKDIYFRNNRAVGFAKAASFNCDAQDPCHDFHVHDNLIVLVPSKNIPSPWGCNYIESYDVAGNIPSGLEECMAKSMNGTSASYSAKEWTRPPKELWWKHSPYLPRHEGMAVQVAEE